MDKKRAAGRKFFFPRFAVQTAPILIVAEGPRDEVVFVNEGPATVYVGVSGTFPVTSWMALPSGSRHEDRFTQDAWWAYAPAGSGTVSGYIVQEG